MWIGIQFSVQQARHNLLATSTFYKQSPLISFFGKQNIIVSFAIHQRVGHKILRKKQAHCNVVQCIAFLYLMVYFVIYQNAAHGTYHCIVFDMVCIPEAEAKARGMGFISTNGRMPIFNKASYTLSTRCH